MLSVGRKKKRQALFPLTNCDLLNEESHSFSNIECVLKIAPYLFYVSGACIDVFLETIFF